MNSKMSHVNLFDFNTLKELHEKWANRHTDRQTSQLLDQSGPRTDSVKIPHTGNTWSSFTCVIRGTNTIPLTSLKLRVKLNTKNVYRNL